MEDQFVTYEQALSLKELGFDMPCLKEFHSKNLITPSTGDESTNTELIELYGDNSVIGAPLKQQVFRWFRDNHKLQSNIIFYECYYEHGDKNVYEVNIESSVDYDFHLHITPLEGFKSYEEAESACIDKLIEIITNKK